MMKFSNLFEKRVEILIGILLFVILFNNKITNLVLSILVLIVFFDKKRYEFKLTNKIIIIIGFFLYLLIRELFALEKQGIDYIVRLLPILVLYISLRFYNFSQKQIRFIARYFILINYIFYTGAVICGVYLYVINLLNGNAVLGFSYYQWVVPVKIGFHPPYWGFFIVLSFIFVLRTSEIKSTNKFLFGVFSFLFLLLLASRTALLVIIAVIVLELIFDKSVKIKTKYFIFISFTLSILVLSFSSSYLSKKIKSSVGIQERIILWEATTDAFKENYIFGNSVAKGNLMIKHFYDLKNSAKDNYDPHNQFLLFVVNYGILGLLLFFVILFYNESYNLTFIMLTCAVLISFMTESVLNRQMGVVTFALFFSLITNKTFMRKI